MQDPRDVLDRVNYTTRIALNRRKSFITLASGHTDEREIVLSV